MGRKSPGPEASGGQRRPPGAPPAAAAAAASAATASLPHPSSPATPHPRPLLQDLNTYQACEHGLKTYITQLQPYKKSLPPGFLRDFKC